MRTRAQHLPKAAKSEAGQGLVEYAITLVLVGVVVTAVLLLLGPAVGNVFSKVACNLRRSGAQNCGTAAATAIPTATAVVSTYNCTAPTLIDQAAVQDKADDTSYCQSNKGAPFKLWYVCSTHSYVGTVPAGTFGGDANHIPVGTGTCGM